MIRVEGIKKAYGDVKVLKGVDLEIRSAEVVTIMGRSGAGKSTLLHILGTLDSPDSGSVLFGNVDVFKLSPEEIARFRNEEVGFVFQFHQLLPEFTAVENVMIPALITGKPTSESRSRAKELLDYLGLSHRLTHKPAALSGGEQQRVAMARALMNKPRVILADEPSGNLDSATSKDLHDLILELRKDLGQTFVIVTHNQELAKLSDRTVTIRDGVILSNDEN
jgi:lipoprotein-releasing system ATP-binding protein